MATPVWGCDTEFAVAVGASATGVTAIAPARIILANLRFLVPNNDMRFVPKLLSDPEWTLSSTYAIMDSLELIY